MKEALALEAEKLGCAALEADMVDTVEAVEVFIRVTALYVT